MINYPLSSTNYLKKLIKIIEDIDIHQKIIFSYFKPLFQYKKMINSSPVIRVSQHKTPTIPLDELNK